MTDTFDYTKSVATADRLITKFGAAALVRRNVASGSPFDPTLSATDYATLAVKVEFTMADRASGDVLATDERWLVAAGPLTVLGVQSVFPEDVLVVAGVERPILIAKPLAPAGTTVLYDCQIRF